MSWGSLQREWHLGGSCGSKFPLGLWVNPKATAVQRRLGHYTELGCHIAGGLSLKYRSFQVILLDVQEDLFSQGLINPKHKGEEAHIKFPKQPDTLGTVRSSISYKKKAWGEATTKKSQKKTTNLLWNRDMLPFQELPSLSAASDKPPNGPAGPNLGKKSTVLCRIPGR